MAQTDFVTERRLADYHDELMKERVWPAEKNIGALMSGDKTAALAETLQTWAEQKALSLEDINTSTVRTSGGDTPLETSEGSALVSIVPAGDWTAKFLFNGSYNMLNAAKWGHDNSQPLVGGTLNGGCYFLVPTLAFGEFGTADENNGLLFTLEDGTNIHPTVYFKPLGGSAPSSLTNGTVVTPVSVTFDGKSYKTYECSEPGWFILTYPSGKTMDDICAHIAWEDWYDKYVGLDEDPAVNPEAEVGVLMLEAFIAVAHADKKLYYINDEARDYIEFGETQAKLHNAVDIKATTSADWTTTEIEEAEDQYLHVASVGSAMKSGGAAILADGTAVTVDGTSVSFVDGNASVSGNKLSIKYERATENVITKAYTDSVFTGSNIDTETGKLNVNDCSIEAQVGVSGTAFIRTKYAVNIVDWLSLIAHGQWDASMGVIAEAMLYLYSENKALRELLSGKDNAVLPYLKAQTIECVDKMTMGVPDVLESENAGAPSAANVPDNWDEATMAVWDGCPRKIGQQYVDKASGKVYYAIKVTGSTSDWALLN